MRQPIPTRARLALAAAVALFLATLVAVTIMASPAQALGWSGQRCDNDSNGEGLRVCVQVHTVASGNKYNVDQVQVCTSMNRANNHVRGTADNTQVAFPGTWNYAMAAIPKNACGYKAPNYVMSNGCYTVTGYVDLTIYPDNSTFRVTGRILGGAC